jgi:hypothetical protein
MTRHEQLLTILSEECIETAQRVSKAIRFGLTEVQEGQPLSNAQRIVYEFNDIVAMMDMLHDEGLVEDIIDQVAIAKKKAKVEKYMEYSLKLGTVS